MIQTQFILYHVIINAWFLYFGVHDLKTHRVEPKARLLFLPFALAAIYINGQLNQNYVKALMSSTAAAIWAFLLFLLLGVLLSKDKDDLAIGGGDVKLMPYIGCIYGIQATFCILFISAVFMLIAGVYKRIFPAGEATRVKIV